MADTVEEYFAGDRPLFRLARRQGDPGGDRPGGLRVQRILSAQPAAARAVALGSGGLTTVRTLLSSAPTNLSNWGISPGEISRSRTAPGVTLAGPGDYNPRTISAQWSILLLLGNSMTPGSIVAAWLWGTTAVATIMSQRSLKATESADLPGRLRAVSA